MCAQAVDASIPSLTTFPCSSLTGPAYLSHREKMRFDWTAGDLAEGLRCYRAQQFWHAHEHWEAVWLKLEGQEKTFLQALIQTTAAFHHLQRGNMVGTASLLRNALGRLDPLPAEFGGINVDALRGSLRGWLDALDRGEAVERISFPELR